MTRHHGPTIVILTALLALAGCLPKPPSREALPQAPSAYSAAPEQDARPVAADWWRDFGNSQLNQLVDEALTNNPSARAAAARLEAAAGQARLAGADRLPSLDAGFNGSRRKQIFIGLPIPSTDGVPSTTATTLNLSLNASWEADLWGRLRAGEKAATADYQASAADLIGIRQSIAAQTAKAWLAVGEAKAQEELADETVASFQTNLNQIMGRYKRGLRTSLDVRLAESNLANAKALRVNRIQQKEIALRQLEQILGRYPGGDHELIRQLPQLPGGAPAGLPADLIRRRPDIAAAEMRLTAADQRWVQAQRRLYPAFSLTASAGTTSNELGDLLDGDFGVWSLAANLVQPIFQGGRIRTGIDIAKAGIDAEQALYVDTVLNAYAEVENALISEQLLALRETHLTTAAQQSRAAKVLAESRYRGGLEPYLAVLESQRLALQAESERISVQAGRLRTRIDLYMALGGGFQYNPQDPDIAESLKKETTP